MPPYNQRIVHLKAPGANQLLSSILTGTLHLAEDEASHLIKLGAIYLNGRRQTQDFPLEAESILRVHLQPKRFSLPLDPPKKHIVFENEDFVVAHKPAGLPSLPTLDNARENFWAFLGGSLLPTHRLDQFTAGLMVFAKTQIFQRGFNRWLAQGRVHKIYLALSSVAPPLGEWVHYMSPEPKAPKILRRDPQTQWKKCRLEILTVEKWSEGLWQSQIRLHTGRTHQIRAQMAALGTPLVNDLHYGGVPAQVDHPPLLATRLSFPRGSDFWVFEVERPGRSLL